MAIVERWVSQVRDDKWEELQELFKLWVPIEQRNGFPPTQVYRYLSGSDPFDALVEERSWESLSAMDAAWQKLAEDPDIEKIGQMQHQITKESRLEYLQVVD